MLRYLLSLLFILSLTFQFAACEEEEAAYPRPRAYPQVEYPQRNYVQFDTSFCNFSFQYPDYMEVQRKEDEFHADLDECWFDLNIPSLNGHINFTYRPLTGEENELYNIFSDAHRLSSEHNKRARSNLDYDINDPKRAVYGVLYEIEGHSASSFQYTVTDSVNHVLRASLYFRSTPEPDSMAPIIDFVRKDMTYMLNTLQWQKPE